MNIMRECDMVTDIRSSWEIKFLFGNRPTRRNEDNALDYPPIGGLCLKNSYKRVVHRGFPGEGFVYADIAERGWV